MEIKDMIKLMQAVAENGLTSFELEEGDWKLTMKREKKIVSSGSQAPVVVPVPGAPDLSAVYGQSLAGLNAAGAAGRGSGSLAAAGASAAGQEGSGTQNAGNELQASAGTGVSADKVVTCPLVGTFYSAPSPDAEDFVKVGDVVKKGQVLGIVEAMKLMNEIESDYDGVVEAILVKNEGVRAVGYKSVTYNEPYFAGHFPSEPVMPGVLIVEALAQTGAVAILSVEGNKGKTAYFGGMDHVKFKKKVVPGDKLRLECQIIRQKGPVGVGSAVATVDGKVAVSAELTFMVG